MKKLNGSNLDQGALASLADEVDEQASNSSQSSNLPSSCLLACASTDDLARYLHTLGWRGTLDTDWQQLATLWSEIDLMRAEIDAFSSTQP